MHRTLHRPINASIIILQHITYPSASVPSISSIYPIFEIALVRGTMGHFSFEVKKFKKMYPKTMTTYPITYNCMSSTIFKSDFWLDSKNKVSEKSMSQIEKNMERLPMCLLLNIKAFTSHFPSL